MSKICSYCNGELEKFLVRKSQKSKLKFDNTFGVCQYIKPKCEKIHNRDKNAVQNMLNIVKTIFKKGKRPEIFCREINS